MSATLFISRTLQSEDELRLAIEVMDIRIIDAPMIELQPVIYPHPIAISDWIFFSSGAAVQFFFRQQPLIQNQKMAAIGKATAKEIQNFSRCDFEGKSNNIDEVIQQFLAIAKGSTVLFPQSNISLRTIQQSLNSELVIDLVCYQTIEHPKKIASADILIFTSPSNARSFLKLNKINSVQRVISFGRSTQIELEKNGVKNTIIPESLKSKDIVKAISQLNLS